jgi:hypothetical protein
MLVLNPRRILRLLLGVSLLIVIGSLATHYTYDLLRPLKLGYLTHLMNVDAEQNVPTWFSSAILLGNGLLFGLIGVVRWQQRAPWRWHWLGLALIFVYLSLDEQAVIHELFNGLRDDLAVSGPLFFAWVVPAAGALLLFALIYFRFWLALPRRIRLLMALAALIYLGGALGFEILSAPLFERKLDYTLPYKLLTAAEELCEMIGASVLLYALLSYLRDELPELSLRWDTASTAPAPDGERAQVSRPRVPAR